MDILISSVEDFNYLKDRVITEEEMGVDFETTSFHKNPESPLQHDKLKLVGIGICFLNSDMYYVPVLHTFGKNVPLDKALELLRLIFLDKDKIVWTHNSKFEYSVLRSVGITATCRLRDSMIAQWMLGKRIEGAGGLKLKAASQKYLKHTMITWEEVMSGHVRAHEIKPEVMAPYCADDASCCLKLGKLWEPALEEYGLTRAYIDLEMAFMPVLVHMKEVGFALDIEYLEKFGGELKKEIGQIVSEFESMVGVSVSSNQAVSRRLYDELEWWPSKGFERGKAGFFSCDSDHLDQVAIKLGMVKVDGKLFDLNINSFDDSDAIIALKLKMRFQGISKLEGTYTRPLVEKACEYEDKRLRGDFHQCGTETTRLSSSSPNLQNIPIRSEDGAKIRNAFIAEKGWKLIVSDYSQADLVMMAHLSQDPTLLKAYKEKLDIHQLTADNCTKDCGFEVIRSTGKTLNLGLIYEMGIRTLAENLKIDETTAGKIHRAWHKTYPEVKKYHKRMHEYVHKYKYVRTIVGEIRFLPDIDSSNSYKRSLSEKAASNCMDFETEVLTKRGWVGGNNLQTQDELLTKNKDSGLLEWKRPIKINLFPDYKGPLVKFETRNFNSMTTPEHRWLVFDKSSNTNICRVTDDISDHGDHRIHRVGSYEALGRDWTDDEVEFIGWLLTDGSYSSYKSTKDGFSVGISLHQSHRAKLKNVERITSLLERLGIKYTKAIYEEGGLTRWSSNDIFVKEIIRIFPKRVLVPSFLLELSSSQLQLLKDVMLLGDGCSRTKVTFSCSNKDKADMFQMLCFLCGIATTAKYRDMSMYSPKSIYLKNIPKMTGVWIITLLKRSTVQVCKRHKTFYSSSTGGVWCPTIENSFFVARRGGSVYITGNTPDQGSVSAVIKIAMRNLYKEWNDRGILYDYWTKTGKAKILSQVHDELIIEARDDFAEEAASDVQRHMEHAVVLRAPMTAVPGIGQNWNKAKSDGKRREKLIAEKDKKDV